MTTTTQTYRTLTGNPLRDIALADLQQLDRELADVQRHTCECTACGQPGHESRECVEWLAERFTVVSDRVFALRTTTRSLARGERPAIDEEARA